MREDTRLMLWRGFLILGSLSLVEAAVRRRWIDPFFLVSPLQALEVLWSQLTTGNAFFLMLVTLYEIAAALLISTVVGLFAGFVLWLLYRLQLLSFAPLVALLNSPWLVATAALLVWLSHPLVALRWQLLLRTQQIDLAYFDVFKLNYAAAFLGIYLPGLVGGDIARVALGFSLSRIQVSALALSVAADRMTGLLGLLIVGTVASSVYLVLLDARLPQYAEMRTLLRPYSR